MMGEAARRFSLSEPSVVTNRGPSVPIRGNVSPVPAQADNSSMDPARANIASDSAQMPAPTPDRRATSGPNVAKISEPSKGPSRARPRRKQRVTASPQRYSNERAHFPSFWDLAEVKPSTETGGGMLPPPSYCPKWSLEVNDLSCFPEKALQLNEWSVRPRDEELAESLPDQTLILACDVYSASGWATWQELKKRYKRAFEDRAKVTAELKKLKADSIVTVQTVKDFQFNLSETKVALEKSKTEASTAESKLRDALREISSMKEDFSEVSNIKRDLADLKANYEAQLALGKKEALQEFIQSYRFRQELVMLNVSAMRGGYTEAINHVVASGIKLNLGDPPFCNFMIPRRGRIYNRRLSGINPGILCPIFPLFLAPLGLLVRPLARQIMHV